MTNRNNDDIADALRGLASGEHPDATRQGEGAVPQHPTPQHPAPPRPSTAAVNTPRPPPVPRPMAPARSAAPASPGARIPPPAAAFAVSDARPAEADDDDAVIMPAPSVEYLAHQPHRAPVSTRSSAERTVRFRRTVIPIMLTGGLLMVAAAVLKYTVDADAPLAAMPTWTAVLLLLAGAALLVVAGLNAAQVRR